MDNKYIILHKDYPVLSVSLEDYKIDAILKIHSKSRLFPGLYRNQLSKYDVNDWLFSRGIPSKRKEIKEILDNNKVESREELIIKNLGLGVTDYYWIKKENDQRTWKEVNFYDNNISEEYNDLYLGISNNKKTKHKGNMIPNPNNGSSGMLPKIWLRENNILHMLKGSELSIHQEPFNEAVISNYLDLLHIDHVHYDLVYINNRPYSKCATMLGKNEELVHTYYIMNMSKKDNKISYLDHYINNCTELGIKNNLRNTLENMLIIDYVSANTDRHWANFGIIRDCDTLKAKKAAPLYDNGASLFAKFADFEIGEANKNLKCQSFSGNLDDSLRLVKDLSLLKNKNIEALPDIINNIFNDKYIYKERKQKILYYTKMRISDAQKRLMNYYKNEKTHIDNIDLKFNKGY